MDMKKYKYRIEIELQDNQQFNEQQFTEYTKEYFENLLQYKDCKVYFVNDLFLIQSYKEK